MKLRHILFIIATGFFFQGMADRPEEERTQEEAVEEAREAEEDLPAFAPDDSFGVGTGHVSQRDRDVELGLR